MENEDMREPMHKIAAELQHAASALEQQDQWKRRFLNGLFFGMGSAIGASLIATLVIFLVVRLLWVFGIDLPELPTSRYPGFEKPCSTGTSQ